MAVRHRNLFSPPRRRESYPRMARDFFPSESYRIRNFPYLDEPYGYSDYMLRGERPIFIPYYETERIPLRREMPAPYHREYLISNSVKGPIKFRNNGLRNDDPNSLRRVSYNDTRNMKTPNGVLPPKDDIIVKIEEDPVTVENPKHVDSEPSILKYCLNRDTQNTIHSLQNDFRRTKKYKSFMMYELPIIPDFKPTPETTINKFHDRFKCLCEEFLDRSFDHAADRSDLNVDLNPNLENSKEDKEKENVGTKEKKAVESRRCSNIKS